MIYANVKQLIQTNTSEDWLLEKWLQARLGHATVSITLDLYTAFIPALDDVLADSFSLGVNVDIS